MGSHPKINQCRLARKLLRGHMPIADVIATLGGKFSETDIQQGIVALQARERSYNGYDGKSPTQLGLLIGAGRTKHVPRTLFAERAERGAFQHTSIVGRLCGDPAPERSALHCPSAPSTPRDPLRNLISPFRRRAHDATATQ